MSVGLFARWKTPEGEEKRDSLIACWRTGLGWRETARWPGEDDARPDLRGIDLRGERLAGFDLSDTRLDGAWLDGADLSRARLCRSSLPEASLVRVIAIELDAFAAVLYGARFEDSTLARATLAAANLASTSWRRVSLRDADLRGATFCGAELLGCRFEGARLAGADLDGALVVGARGLRRNRHDRDEVDTLSPAFAPLLRMHMQLLHGLSSHSQKVAEGCLLGSPRPEAEVQALVLDDDWRVTLAGVAAAVALGPEPRVGEALWLALEGGSWVAPQLAGAASLLDPRFAERAAAFSAPTAPASFASPVARASSASPVAPASSASSVAGGPGRPAKSLVSVAALLDRAGNLPAPLAALPEAEGTRQITLRWRDRSARFCPGAAERP